MERPGTLLVSVHQAVEEVVRGVDLAVVDVEVADAQVVLEAAAATTVVSQVTCLVTAQSPEWVVVAAAVVAATVLATTAERVDICPATALTEWVAAAAEDPVAIVLMDASATTAMRPVICRVIAQMLIDDHLTGVA